MSEFKGQTLSWQIVNGAIELALHRDPCNEIGSLTLVELEKFAAALPGLANEAHALIVHSTLKTGFSAGADLRELFQRGQEMKKGAGKLYAMAFLASLVSAAVLAKFFGAMGVDAVLYGLKIAFAVWLGFVATVQLTATLFGKKPIVLFFIDTGYQFVSYVVMAVVLTVGK